METSSLLSSLHDECRSDNYIEPHYKEWYRVAIDALIEGGLEAYKEFLSKERCSEFLADEEIDYILNNVHKLPQNTVYSSNHAIDDTSSSGTYWPIESDVEAPNLDLGWPYLMPGISGGTNIDLLFHPPRAQPYTIKETIRKMIRDARKVIAIVMDMFTDVDIFREIVEASARGIAVYLLLDESNFSHFLKMTEKQGCQVQRLRNMRVRTVKGQDYYSKTGAKFHGKMEQKFILVDCKKVIYGSYSFMWSFEKTNLSMVQVITGQLVESFDEEFRTLYARSSVPSSFAPELVRVNSRRTLWDSDTYQHSVSSLASVSSQRNLFGRQDKVHKIDPVCWKTRGRYAVNEIDKYGLRNQSYNKQPFHPGFNMQNPIQQYQPSEKNEHWKRHSYAGEKPERTPYLLLNRAINRANNPSNTWKMASDSLSIVSSLRGGYANNYNTPQQSFADQFSRPKVNLAERNSIVRRSFNGTDNHIRHLQQRMPTLEHTTKSFLRNWRIKSYLNDQSDYPVESNGSALGDRYDSYDTPENIKAHALYSHSRLRSSLVFQPTLPEQQEVSSCASSSNSTIIGSEGSATPKGTSNHAPSVENGTDNISEEPSTNIPPKSDTSIPPRIHIADYTKPSVNSNAAGDSSVYLYTTLCADKHAENLKNLQNENMLKRRSFPMFNSKSILDPGANKHASNYVYSTLTRHRLKQPVSPKLPEDMLKSAKSLHSMTNHLPQEEKNLKEELKSPTASKAVSMAALTDPSKEESSKDCTSKKESKSSPSFLKKGSQKLRSLLNLTPDKKENLSKNKGPAFYRMCSSSDTLVSEEENQKPKMSENKTDSSPRRKRNTSSNSQGSLNRSKEDVTGSPTKSPKSPKSPKPQKTPSDESNKKCPLLCPLESKFIETAGDPSTPRFNTEQIQYQDVKETTTNTTPESAPVSALQRASSVTPQLASSKCQEELRSRLSERRVYSRFEPFCKLENSSQPAGNVPNSSLHLSDIKSKTLGNNYGRSNHMVSYNSTAYHPLQPNENKLRGFMQKFGNFLHKNK
ncbi:protein FAM83B isoform X1 [Pezoporus flaviventris]|uniref:protein FAM83B isoform X1 n=2 Tax=Pezoporus flaviventris TaxID=889875 RepID=UPI002AB19164|nr:protein FAM83B isoform X1 [Pezoporus flaviventris]XP_061316583.1 protein FAM83B isoform X1 [Pezoporus flaviventris]